MLRIVPAPALALALLASSPFAQTLAGLPATAMAQGVSYVAGTGIGLVPPKGMVPSKTFAGFENQAIGASILVTELPAEAYPQLLAAFNPEGLSGSGLQASGAAIDWKVAGGQGGRMIRGKQAAHGTQFRKWLMMAKGPASTVMLSVQVPDAKSGDLPDAAVEAALKTVAVKAPPSLDAQAAALPFRLGDRAGFRLVRVIAGSGLLLTDGARDTVSDASQPVVIVASAIGAVDAKDRSARQELSARAFDTIAGVSDVSIVSQTITEKDDVAWSRIEGRGTYRQSMEAVSILQLVRFDKSGYVRVVAIVRTLDKDNVLPRVEALAASITSK